MASQFYNVVPVKKPVYLQHLRPLHCEILRELAQDHHGAFGVDGGTSWCDMHVDQSLAVEESKEHLFCLAGMDSSCLDWALVCSSPATAGIVFFCRWHMVADHFFYP